MSRRPFLMIRAVIIVTWLLALAFCVLVWFSIWSLVVEISEAGAGEPRRVEHCLFQRDDPGIWTPPEEERTMRCVLGRWPVPGGITRMRSVGECESHWNRLARNHNVGDDYLGLFQHDEGSWPDRVNQAFRTLPRDWRLKVKWQNSRTQIIVTAWLARQQGWTPWAGCL